MKSEARMGADRPDTVPPGRRIIYDTKSIVYCNQRFWDGEIARVEGLGGAARLADSWLSAPGKGGHSWSPTVCAKNAQRMCPPGSRYRGFMGRLGAQAWKCGSGYTGHRTGKTPLRTGMICARGSRQKVNVFVRYSSKLIETYRQSLLKFIFPRFLLF